MTSPRTSRDTQAPAGENAAIGYFWGDDAYGLDHAAARLGERLADAAGGPLDRWRVSGTEITAEQIGERVATGTLFGGGTLAIVGDPFPLIRARDARDALIAIFPSVAPGNGLVFLDPMEQVSRKGLDAARLSFATAVKAHGGEARPFEAPKGAGLITWIEARAREHRVPLARGAAAELARRLGGLVREGDIDRRRQGQLAVRELDKLSLLHLDASEVTVDDVRDLVPEAIPGSAFAFLDALGERRSPEAADLLERLFLTTPEPVILAQLYSRVRQLLEVADRLAAGEGPRELSTAVRVHPFVLDKLVHQARAWTVADLTAALEGLFDLDVLVKGADRTGSSEEGRRLAFALWLDEHVAGHPSGRSPA